MTRPLPPHGTPARYYGNSSRPGCRCQPCSRAATREDALRILDRLNGRPRRVPSGPVWQHILNLRATGLNDRQIRIKAGITGETAIARVGRQPTVSRNTADRILAVPLTHKADSGFVPALGSMRRMQALYVQGHGNAELAQATGFTAGFISALVGGHFQYVKAHTASLIRQQFAELSTRQGGNKRAMARGREEGWHGPMAWDDIDDPSAQPYAGLNVPPIKQSAERTTEVLLLADAGVLKHEIARRVDISLTRVEEILREHRPVLVRQIKAASDAKRGNRQRRSAA